MAQVEPLIRIYVTLHVRFLQSVLFFVAFSDPQDPTVLGVDKSSAQKAATCGQVKQPGQEGAGRRLT